MMEILIMEEKIHWIFIYILKSQTFLTYNMFLSSNFSMLYFCNVAIWFFLCTQNLLHFCLSRKRDPSSVALLEVSNIYSPSKDCFPLSNSRV